MAFLLNAAGKQYPVLNLTPHAISWCPTGAAPLMSIPSSGQIRLTRAPETEPVKVTLVQNPTLGCMEKVGPIQDTFFKVRPFNGLVLSDVTEQDLIGKALIVSMPVAQYLRSEATPLWAFSCLILAPDTGPESAVRNEAGQIVGVKTFTVY